MSTCKLYNLLHFESKAFKKLCLFPNQKIDAKLATDLLQINFTNRPIKNFVVDNYTADMKNGRWQFTGDTIQISSEGKLLNGQHRLMAIIKSDTAQIFHIQTGLSPESFSKMDIGKVRTAGDTLATTGYKHYSSVATIVRYVSMYDNGLLPEYVTNGYRAKFSNQEIANEAAKLNKTLLEETANVAGRFVGKARFLDMVSVSSLFYIFRRINNDAAANFFQMLSSGDGIGSEHNSSIYLLRQKFIASMGTGNKISSRHKFVITIKAWNYYRKNKQIKQLSYNETEPFPIPE